MDIGFTSKELLVASRHLSWTKQSAPLKLLTTGILTIVILTSVIDTMPGASAVAYYRGPDIIWHWFCNQTLKVGTKLNIIINITSLEQSDFTFFNSKITISADMYDQTFTSDISLDENITLRPNETWTGTINFTPPFLTDYSLELHSILFVNIEEDNYSYYSLTSGKGLVNYTMAESGFGTDHDLFPPKPKQRNPAEPVQPSYEPLLNPCFFMAVLGLIWVIFLAFILYSVWQGYRRSKEPPKTPKIDINKT
jgi:hypothetical protein